MLNTIIVYNLPTRELVGWISANFECIEYNDYKYKRVL